MNEWNIQTRAQACEVCGQPFADKRPLHTLLYDEAAELRRSDICDLCWQNQFSQGARDRKGFVSHWQGIFEVPPPAADPIHKDTAETLLRKLIEQNDPPYARYASAGYILAVMLERKRILKVKEQIVRDGAYSFTNNRKPATYSRLPTRICGLTSSNKSSATWRNCWNMV